MSAWKEIDEEAERRLQASQEAFQREYRFTLGRTEITCHRCGHTTVVENEDLEAMRKCPLWRYRMGNENKAEIAQYGAEFQENDSAV